MTIPNHNKLLQVLIQFKFRLHKVHQTKSVKVMAAIILYFAYNKNWTILLVVVG